MKQKKIKIELTDKEIELLLDCIIIAGNLKVNEALKAKSFSPNTIKLIKAKVNIYSRLEVQYKLLKEEK